MKFRYSVLFFILISVICVQSTKAQIPQLSDSSKVSLLTNTAWDGAVYALFGHTAIRINDPVNDVDITFNYGLFDFNAPNFMYRFVKGETDYSVGYTYTDRYILEYQMRGIGITEQHLDLSKEEKQKLLEALLINIEPQNKIYRYNYFFDNCTTRARDMIENSINGTIIYQESRPEEKLTYRTLIHLCVNSQTWVRFGIDLVIGADADKPIMEREVHFLPAYLMNAFDKAIIKNSESERKLVINDHELLRPIVRYDQEKVIDYPLIFGIILLIVSILVSYLAYKQQKTGLAKVFDFLLFLFAGVAGSIIFFLMYFSVHPCTNPNWNLVWLNPLQLVFAFLFLIKFFSKSVYCYHFINFTVLILFLLAWFLIPQYLEAAFVPYILAMAVRSATNVLQYRRNIKQYQSV